jgi:RNA polymerase-binding transcription factor DksA
VRLLHWIIDFAFGCHHKLSSVVTIKKRTYQICIECGQEFPYSWELMRPVGPYVANPRTRHADPVVI